MPFLLAGFLIAHMEDQQTCTFSKKILVRLFFLSNTELRNPSEVKALLPQCSITISLETVDILYFRIAWDAGMLNCHLHRQNSLYCYCLENWVVNGVRTFFLPETPHFPEYCWSEKHELRESNLLHLCLVVKSAHYFSVSDACWEDFTSQLSNPSYIYSHT